MVSSLSILAFGLFLLQVRNPKVILPVFFACYLVFSLCIGLTLPVWLNFLVKIFSSRKNVQGLSIMYASQNVSKIASSLIILGLVESYAFSLTAAAWIFLSAGALFLVGSLCFLLTRELPVTLPEKGERNGFFLHVTKTFQEMTANKPLIRYLIGDLDYIITLTVIAFYANYATQYFGVEKYVAAGLFVCFIYTGAITANLLLGTIGFLTLKQKFLATKFFNLALLLLLIWSPGMISFLAASALLGLCRGTRSIIYSPAVKQLSRRADATAYFALAPLLTIGFGAGFPLFFGHMLDRFSALGAGAYQLMFCFCMVCVMITLGVAWFTDFDFQSAP
jgi:MFS family permease